MTVYELIERIDNGEKLDEVITVKKYLPVMQKKDLAHQVLAKASAYYDGAMHIDSVNKEIYFSMAVVQAYTDIEVSGNHD